MGIAAFEVPLVAIDGLLPPEFRVDFVFVDSQGYDHRIARGMRSVIERMRPPYDAGVPAGRNFGTWI
jgi:hypothetical protein